MPEFKSVLTFPSGEFATPVSATRSANAAGSATTLSKSDHKHDIATGAAAATFIGDAAGTGSSTNTARDDHVHDRADDAAQFWAMGRM